MPARKIENVWCVDFPFDRKRYRRKSPENSKAGALAYETFLKARLLRGEKINEE
jgi:hypothetical protein